MRKNNEGFTMVELIIVIAIMAVLLSFFVSNIGYVTGSAVRGCAKSIKTGLSEVRVKTMGKSETLFCLYRGSDGYYIVHCVDGVTEGAEKCGRSDLTIRYYTASNPTVAQTVTNGAPLVVGFDRANGAIDTGLSANVNIEVSSVSVTAVDCNRIEVVGGGKTEEFMISTVTGKVYSD